MTPPVPARAWSSSAPRGPWDVLVVGAGMGGLTAASLLAHVGKRVLVLEQHGVPGGFTQSFRRKEWSWDVGLHVVGEMGPSAIPGRVLAALTGGALEWTRVETPYDVVDLPDGTSVPLPAGLGALRRSLEGAFPGSGPAIGRYLSLVRLAAAGLRDQFVGRSLPRARSHHVDAARAEAARRLALTRTGEVLRSVTDDPRLRAVLGVQWGFYGSPPDRSCFGVHALICRHYRQGAYYPRGGAMSIPRALCRSLAARGGWTRVGAGVERLLFEHGRVRGVRMEDAEELLAPVVIGAGGALNTLALLPEEERRREWGAAIAGLSPSCAHLSLNLGLRGDIRAAGATTSNRWLVEQTGIDAGPWDLGAQAPSLYLSFPSLKDGRARPVDGAHTAELVVLTSWEPFARWRQTRWQRRGAEYDALKRSLTARLLAQLFRRMPALEPMLAWAELSTPLSSAHFARAVDGAAYGLEARPERFTNPWLRPRTPVKGLFLAGADVGLVGVVGALVGGVAAAVAVEPAGCMEFLQRAARARRSGILHPRAPA